MWNYGIVKIFATLQGEGALMGTPAIFVRFAGCNLWSGHDARRERSALRAGAECPRWCDTDFKIRESLNAANIADRIAEKMKSAPYPLIVLTGGEPALQVDTHLLDSIRGVAPNSKVQIETNGTLPIDGLESRPWVFVTCSPKKVRAETKLERADELKLVWPAYNPADWEDFPARHYSLQAQAAGDRRDPTLEAQLVEYIKEHPKWRLSIQTHKILGIE